VFGGWNNLERVNWQRLASATDGPWFFPAVFVIGIAWVLFIGEPRRGGRDGVAHRGLRWRYQSFNPQAVNPYPYCPRHDLRLLWEADDKSNASWELHDVARGMWFGSNHNGHLWCSHGDGHAIQVAGEGWMAQQAALEASALLERNGRSANPTLVS